QLARRRLGYGRGPRMRIEADEVTILAGVRHGRTLGSPVAIEIANSEWEVKWKEEMSPDPGKPSKVLTTPRPGHADLAGMQKYGLGDARDVLERASARETAARVAAGSLAKALLSEIGVYVVSHTIQMGDERSDAQLRPMPEDIDRVDASSVRCLDKDAEQRMISAIKAAAKEGDSLGGVSEIIAYGVPVGLGSHVHWDRKLDGLLAQAICSIHAVKAVEIGDGFSNASLRGSQAHDAIYFEDGGISGRGSSGSPSSPGSSANSGSSGGYKRRTSRAGGIEGGISIGGDIIVRAYMKPLATLNRPVIETVDLATGERALSFKERTDTTAVPAMGVVAEAMVALTLASEALRKYGGDSLAEFKANHNNSIEALQTLFV
ncbi:MAG: chorismate synthase, partial [Actinobacteria bacterium]|nr:chorismate synthase [Actinomycetota bacterium]